jgi:SOS-response transcriptional repressor LexA
MSRVLPAGYLAFVDPQIQPTNGAIVLAKVMLGDKVELAVRRLHLGSTKALLSAESYEADQEDIVVDMEQLDIRGTVFWYQASGELI